MTPEQVANNPHIPEKDKNSIIILYQDKCETAKDCLLGVQICVGTCRHTSYAGTKDEPCVMGLSLINKTTLANWSQMPTFDFLTSDESSIFFNYCPRCGRKINWDKLVPNGNSLSKIELMAALAEKSME